MYRMFYYISRINSLGMKKIVLLLLLSVAIISCGKDGGSKPRNTATGDALVGTWINPDYPTTDAYRRAIGYQKMQIEKLTNAFLMRVYFDDNSYGGTGFIVPRPGVLQHETAYENTLWQYKFWFAEERLYFKFDKTIPAGGEVPDNADETLVYDKVEL